MTDCYCVTKDCAGYVRIEPSWINVKDKLLPNYDQLGTCNVCHKSYKLRDLIDMSQKKILERQYK